MSEKVTHLHDHRDGDAAALAERYRKAAVDGLAGLLDALFDGADDALFGMAEKAESNQEQSLFFDTMRAVRLERPHIASAFVDALAERLRERRTDKYVTPDGDDLSLMPQEDVEETVAVTNMVSKGGALFREEIADLESRLSRLAERPGVRVAPDGASPESVCEAFRTAMSPVDLAIEIKLLIYKLFDRFVIARLGEVYRDLNALLGEAGLESDHGNARAARSSGTAANGRAARWSNRLASLHTGIAPEGEYGTAEVFEALSGIQAREQSPEALLSALLDHLRSRQHDSTPRTLQKGERRLLSRVSQMFADILEDEGLSDPGRRLVARVRVPVLKAALLDERFFRDAEHPARQLVNELAALGATMRDERSGLFDEAADLIDRLVDEFDDDPSVMEWVAAGVRRLGERAAAREERASRLRRAKRHAILELRQQSMDRYLPESAQPFLLRAWGPLMAIQYLRHGHDSEQYARVAQGLGCILDALQPEDPATRRHARTQALDLARDGLRELAIEYAQAEELLRGLETGMAEADRAAATREQEDVAELSGWSPDADVLGDAADEGLFERGVAAASGAADNAEPEPPPVIEELTPAVTRFLEATCKPGAWFQLRLEEAGATRWLKSAAYDRAAGVVRFVNRRGETVLEREALAFARDLQAGRAKPVYDVDAFERRLAGIIGNQSRRLDST